MSALDCVGLVMPCRAIRSAGSGGGSDWYWCRVGVVSLRNRRRLSVLAGYDLRLLYICHR